MFIKKTKFLIILLTAAVILSGCSLFSIRRITPAPPRPAPTPPTDSGQGSKTIEEQLAKQTKIKKFESVDELKNFMEENAVSRSYGYGGIARGWGAPRAELKEVEAPLAMDGGGEVINYSKTNVQVEGVDEADIIKTDGKYIYAVANNSLFIVEAYPAENANILSKIAFKSSPQDIYINGDYLIVFGQDQELYNTELYKGLKRRSNFTFLKVFDIKDRKNPREVRDLDFEGSYFNSRMIGDYIYFVTNYYSYYYIEDMPVPMIIENRKDVINKCATDKCAMPPVYYFDIPYDNYNFTTVSAINVKDANEKAASESYLLSGNQNMYVSQNNIYITYTKYISEYQLAMEVMKEVVYPRLSAKDQEKIAKIEQTENYILSPQEKMEKISRILENYSNSLTEEERKSLEKEVKEKLKQKYEDISKELEKTVIHKIAINNGKLEYKTFGEVTGQVLNQFSMDESGGYFRIATTKNTTWSQFAEGNESQSYSNLYVLDENLKVVGSLENLAPGERIYSVRFMQGRAYMVTFRQTDPLFVIDLKDPANPKVLGKLKVPGFSNYLHPYDDTTLIGIGKETEESEWGGVITGGIKLSLFDAADVENPKEIGKYVIGDRGSDSIALQDHKAFLFSREKNLLVIPASVMESTDPKSYGKFVFGGAVVFKVDKNGFELKGKIDHSDNGQKGVGEYWGGYSYYDNTVKRSLYVGDVLYTFSSKYLKMNKLSDLSAVKKIELKADEPETNIQTWPEQVSPELDSQTDEMIAPKAR
jgi:uncharacterized secreted protein with C-terminal beta-propeller domain